MLLGCKLRINFSSTYTMRDDCNPLAHPYFNCVRQSHLTHRVYASINKFPRFPFRRFSGIAQRKPCPPDRKCMRVYFAEPRTPIECKIMAVCRIFAGATVTNISDKATPAPAPPTAFRPIPSRPGVPFRISLY